MSDICFEGLKILVMVAGINQICTSLGKKQG